MKNTYEDEKRADAYAKLEFPGTYFLAYRDLPEIISKHVQGKEAIDFGCGAGRSTRFLKQHGFHVIGVDISNDMLKQAKAKDPGGDYRLITEDGLGSFEANRYDLILAAFPFDNVPTMEKKIQLFGEIQRVLRPNGIAINLVSSPEIYTHEFTSTSSKGFPENRLAKTGDIVKVIVTDMEDQRPFEDTFMTDESYRQVYKEAGLKPIAVYRPLGREEDRIQWTNETTVPPWVIYVLGK